MPPRSFIFSLRVYEATQAVLKQYATCTEQLLEIGKREAERYDNLSRVAEEHARQIETLRSQSELRVVNEIEAALESGKPSPDDIRRPQAIGA